MLWIGFVGNPSTAMSPSMRPVRRLINQPERQGTTKGREREEYRVNAKPIFPQEPTAADAAPHPKPTEEAT
ncbi:hypothetical protein ASF53_11650 [Methylobacterium sp. Leaf123]|nr:hypothetical protein ASF53_11650 [Methylobacterium sp. Leaf123]